MAAHYIGQRIKRWTMQGREVGTTDRPTPWVTLWHLTLTVYPRRRQIGRSR
jgi:hypothetical protein